MKKPTAKFNRLVDIAKEKLPFSDEVNEWIISQWALECNFGQSDLFKKHQNAAGLKWRPKRLKNVTASAVSYVAHDGRDKYSKFSSLDDFVVGWTDFILFGPYNFVKAPLNDGREFIKWINDHGYSELPTSEYLNRIEAVKRTLSIEQK